MAKGTSPDSTTRAEGYAPPTPGSWLKYMLQEMRENGTKADPVLTYRALTRSHNNNNNNKGEQHLSHSPPPPTTRALAGCCLSLVDNGFG